MTNITTEDIKHEILDIFEKFLEEKGVVIDNPDRNSDDHTAIIYGDDYFRLERELEKPIGDAVSAAWHEGMDYTYALMEQRMEEERRKYYD